MCQRAQNAAVQVSFPPSPSGWGVLGTPEEGEGTEPPPPPSPMFPAAHTLPPARHGAEHLSERPAPAPRSPRTATTDELLRVRGQWKRQGSLTPKPAAPAHRGKEPTRAGWALTQTRSRCSGSAGRARRHKLGQVCFPEPSLHAELRAPAVGSKPPRQRGLLREKAAVKTTGASAPGMAAAPREGPGG